MLLTSQRLFADSHSMLTFANLYLTRNSTLSLSIAVRQHLANPAHFRILKLRRSLKSDNFNSLRTSSSADPVRLRAYESDGAVHKDVVGDFNLDSLLSLAELLCLLSSAVLSVGFAVNSVISASKKDFLVSMGNKYVLWGVLMLVSGVVIGAWIRRRQWRRICRETHKAGLEVNLLARIEKLEEDLKSSVAVVRVLSRQLEKLGIRFRVTRKGLKEPITEVNTSFFFSFIPLLDHFGTDSEPCGLVHDRILIYIRSKGGEIISILSARLMYKLRNFVGNTPTLEINFLIK